MKFLHLLAFLFILQIVHYGQVVPKPSPLVPPPVVEEWRSTRPMSDVFSVDSPGDLSRSIYSDKSTSQSFMVRTQNVNFYVFSDPIESPEHFRSVTFFLKELGGATALLKVESEGGIQGFVDKYGYSHKFRIIITKDRIYSVQAFSLEEGNKEADRFVSSFSIDPDRKFPRSFKDESRSTVIKGQTSATPMGGGTSGVGSGTKPNTASGVGTGPESPPPSGNSGLRLLSKPRPSYTEAARFYMIAGTVVFRVMFHSSGNVSDVKIISGLPMGVTDLALDAARRITFTPAYVDGKPVTISKAVHYSFVLY